MADSFRVQINLPVLQHHFAAAGEEMTPEQVKAWLHEEGFREQQDGSWLCEEISLELLDRSEIVSVKRF